jgi:hypothetical protein
MRELFARGKAASNVGYSSNLLMTSSRSRRAKVAALHIASLGGTLLLERSPTSGTSHMNFMRAQADNTDNVSMTPLKAECKEHCARQFIQHEE